jgi:hypothetical protein
VSSHDVMCAFCGQGVQRGDVDPCALVVIANWRALEEEWREQQFFTHAECLRTRLHPKAAANAFCLDILREGK